MKEKKYTYLAVDVAKAILQMQTRERAGTLSYDRRGIQHILKEARKDPDMVVVLEATGGFERELLEALHGADVPCVLVNAGRVRAFASSEGIKAKTDPIDARMILRFAEEKALQLKILRLEQRIKKQIKSDQTMQEAVELIESVQGVGPVTAWAILAHLPEITQLSRNQLCSLVGVAPFNRDSGRRKGIRCIHGGRMKVRNPLYMAAVSAATHNPVIKDYVRGLIKRGKPIKCAIVAAMRKLLLQNPRDGVARRTEG